MHSLQGINKKALYGDGVTTEYNQKVIHHFMN